MADWHTPTQVQSALETMWMKLERTSAPLKEIKDEDLINYYNRKQDVAKTLQYDLCYNANQFYDQRVKKDTLKSQKQIHDNIYNEEMQRAVPLVSSHQCGHRPTDLEGRSLYNHKIVEYKDDYRRSGLPLNQNVGLPKSTNELFAD